MPALLIGLISLHRQSCRSDGLRQCRKLSCMENIFRTESCMHIPSNTCQVMGGRGVLLHFYEELPHKLPRSAKFHVATKFRHRCQLLGTASQMWRSSCFMRPPLHPFNLKHDLGMWMTLGINKLSLVPLKSITGNTS